MTKPRLVNLLDDFGLGGVTRGLVVFDSAAVQQHVTTRTLAIRPTALIAPRLDADIIVTHVPPNWRRIAFFATLALRNPHARLVHVEHSYTEAWERANVPHRTRFRAMLRLALAWVDKVVCVSHGQAAWLSHAAGQAARQIEVIHPIANEFGLHELPLPNWDATRRLRIGAYGRFHEAKGFDRLIRAFRAGHLPDCELLIGGFGPEEARLRTLAGDDPLIRFVGKVTDVAAFLEGCDAVALPSRWEAYGQVANEAREAGRPILVAAVDGLVEQVGEAGLVVDFDSPDSLQEAIAVLRGGALAPMARAGRVATRDCHAVRQASWGALIARLLARSSEVNRASAPA